MPPAAVIVVDRPSQITLEPTIAAVVVGLGFAGKRIVFVPTQGPAKPVTVYTVLTYGFTITLDPA